MKTLLLASAMIVSIATAAHAWDTTINNGGRGGTGYGGAGGSSASQSNAAANANAAAQSRARSASTSSVTIESGALGNGNNGRGGGNGNGGWGHNNDLPVATAYAPSFGAANPCVGTSASLGAEVKIFGISAGGQSMDEECRMLRLGTPGDVAAARNLICLESANARRAYLEAGMPCPADHEKYQQVSATQVAYTPTRTFDCNKVRLDTGRGRMSDEDMAIYRSCH